MASQPLTQTTPLAHLGDVTKLSGLLGESQELAHFRRQAAELARVLPLPNRAKHLWRFTDPSLFVPKNDPAALGPQAAPELWRWEDEVSAAVLLAGHQTSVLFISDEAASQGVRVAPPGDPAVLPYLGKAVGPHHGFVEALNAAAFRPGVALVIPPGVQLAKPLRLRVDASSSLSIPRMLLVIGEGARVEVLEGHVGGQEDHLVLAVTEAFVGPGAELFYSLVQRWRSGVTGHLTSRVVLREGARASLTVASFGGKLTKVDTGAILTGERAEVETSGVCLGSSSQHFDHHTEHIHLASRTHSNLDFKVALAAKARSAYTGLIRIEESAAGCEAYQENRNLLLSREARADSIPELEILNEDVRCTHGATVAPLDEEQVFYLTTRGLSRHQAMRLIIYGFLDHTLSRLPQATRERIEALVAGRLHGEVL